MKNKTSFISNPARLTLAFVSIFLWSFTSFAQPPRPTAENVVVTLNVDTGQIEKRNTDTTCNFGQEEGISNEEFTIEVNVGDVITWQGVSSSSPDTDVVDIVKIKYEKGKNIFRRDLDTKDNGKHKRVSAEVLERTTEEEAYKYTIFFTVTNNGVKRNGMFQIDPKIQSH